MNTLCTCFLFYSKSSFSRSEYAPVLEPLVDAYREKAEEDFIKYCSDTVFKIMDIEVRSCSANTPPFECWLC